MLTLNQVLKQVKRIEFNSKILVDELLNGNQDSPFSGSGLEFSDIKEYTFGDDLRRIDWKLSIKHNKVYIRKYTETKNLYVYFLFDVSSSFDLGYKISKKDKSICLIASLIFAALRKDASIGLIMFSDKIEKELKPIKGSNHAINLIEKLINYNIPKKNKTDLKRVLKQFDDRIENRCLIFIISDFKCKMNFFSQLRLIHKKHDIVPIIVNDKNENLFEDNINLIEDSETGDKIFLNYYDKYLIGEIIKEIKEKENSIISLFDRIGIKSLTISTDEEYEYALRRFYTEKFRRASYGL